MRMNLSLTLPLRQTFLERRKQIDERGYVGAGFLDVRQAEKVAAEAGEAREATEKPSEAAVTAKENQQASPRLAEETKKVDENEKGQDEASAPSKSDPEPPKEAPKPTPKEPLTHSQTIPEAVFSAESVKLMKKFQEKCIKIKDKYAKKDVLQVELPEDLAKSHPGVVSQILRVQEKFYQIQSDLLEVVDGSDDILTEAVSLALLCGGYRLDRTPIFLKAVKNEIKKVEHTFEAQMRTLNKAFGLELDDVKASLARQVQLTQEATLRAQVADEELAKLRKEMDKAREIYVNSKITVDTKMKNFEELNRFIIDVLEDKKRINTLLETKNAQILALKRELNELKASGTLQAPSQQLVGSRAPPIQPF